MTASNHVSITDIPIACNLTGEQLTVYRQESMSVLSQMVENQELTDGYAFRFPNTDDVAQQLLAFILAERQCCPFFQIELAFMPDNGPIWLNLRGGDGVKRFIETELAVMLM